MKSARDSKLLSLGIRIMCATALSACASLAFASDNAFDPATVDAIGDKVADWQLANLDDLGYIRSNRFGYNRPANRQSGWASRRGWQHAALYVGMMNWTELPGNAKYLAPLRQIGEENQWELGDRLFHADDHAVGQMYLAIFEKDADPEIISHTIAQFNQISVADPDGSLE